VNVVGELLFDPNTPALEDVGTFYFSNKDEDDDAMADINNLDTTIQVNPTPTIIIHKDHPLDQMDVKSVFLYRKIEEEVYVKKALHGLHQAPRALYETLSTYMLDNGFQRGKIDKTLFIKMNKGDILLVQVYVDDIIFGSTRKDLFNAFERFMREKIHMSSMGKLTFFLGLQVNQKNDGIYISQDKYVAEILKKFGFIKVKNASIPMETQKPPLKDEDGKEVDVHMYMLMIGSLMYLTSSRPDIMFAVLKDHLKLGLWYPKDSSFDLVAYTDSDYAGASLDRISTTGGCQCLGCGGPRCQDTIGDTIAQTRLKNVSKLSNDSLLARGNTLHSDEDKMKLNELMKLCTKLQSTFLNLEKTKTTQALKITSLKRMVKKLEKNQRSRMHKLKRLYKDKDKGIMIKEPVKLKKKDQIRLDEEAAKTLQAKFDEKERLTREKVKKEERANIALIETWDDIKANINVDHRLAKRLQAQEQEELSDVEKATLFQQLLDERRKHFAAKRAEEKMNKPPRKAQRILT
nr:uncharacterized mitochondrial protein AtMg00810-like [Tanacetum cinerariifolium]